MVQSRDFEARYLGQFGVSGKICATESEPWGHRIFSNLDRKDGQQEVPSQTSGDLLELQKTLSDFKGILTLLSSPFQV